MRKLIAILICILSAFSAGSAMAAFERSVYQYHHRHWSEESDAPKPVFAVKHGRRGYIWIASANGLFRFDGIRFDNVSEGIDLIRNGPPSAILVRRNGDIWTNFGRSGRFAVYRDGRFRFLDVPRSPDRVQAMHETGDGTIWVLTERIGLPLLRYRAGRWTSFGTGAAAPIDNPFSMVVTRDGTVWVSFTGSVARMSPGKERFEIVRKKERALGRLSLDPQERVWLTEQGGSYPITGPGGHGAPPPLRFPYATDAAEIRGWPMFDREGNLWISTYYNGIQRVARPDPRGAASQADAVASVEHFTARDGLSSNATTAISQDAEGNIWAGTENGVDRFWPATVRFEPGLTDPAAFGDLLLRASDGTVYIGQASTVYRVRPGGHPEAIFHPLAEPNTLCEAPDGSIWIGVRKNLFAWRDGQVRQLAGRIPLNSTIYDCAFDTNGDYWITASLGGMARRRGATWDQPFGPSSRDFIPKSMTTDANGRVFVQWNDRTLARVEGARSIRTAIPWHGYEPDDAALYPAPDGSLFVAGRFGLARLRGGRFQSISANRMPPFSGVNGMVVIPGGESWLAGPAGIMQIAPGRLDKAFADPRAAVPVRVFGALDGLRSLPHDHSRRSIVRGGDGRLWIATQTGTLWLDPEDIARTRSPPNVAISGLFADRRYRDPRRIKLPAGTSDVEIDFAVLNFSNPRATRVRYRIEGQDRGWVDAGTRRQAFYTNLPPGSYRFHVVAANDDGVWNEEGAAVDFEIPPTFTQSRWFLLLCVVAGLLLAWAILQWRYAEAMRRLRSRLEERVSERERIARDLHDTLLQGVQGLVLQFQAVADRMPRENAERASLHKALNLADDVILEGRERVQALRGHQDSTDLENVIRNLVKAHPFYPAVQVTVEVEGTACPVDPFVASEIALIGGEALFNIAHHAGATEVDIIVRFDRDDLTIRFRDNGAGIPDAILRAGRREGHFGLITMRERAERIGGKFSIDSAPGKGTTVSLSLTANLVYKDARRAGPWKRIKEYFAGGADDSGSG
ncbi:Two component regulator propeller [Sphingopyxis sp. YR583]|uniref:sensor histidine kinase n=1 Tax=Sphingopyxis sp. YR583 TaxID=1881047 RepID=UPI0008A73C92|nr:sensor histidine kinase [Sphingopyxis sp. YR583]SEH13318.1 Two component regulator propeller [Sphingopyxis sp. YR583]